MLAKRTMSRPLTDLRKRTFFGLCGAIIFISAIITSSKATAILFSLLFFISLFELFTMYKQLKNKLSIAHLILLGIYPVIITAGTFSAILLRRKYPSLLLLTVIICTWSADSGANFYGMKFGKHFMIPTISPSKTWEGAVGGFVAPIIAALILGLFSKNFTFSICTGIVAGTFGQLGDIVESKIKRIVEIKDSGSLIPGHGGMLDRFDAFFFNSTAMFFIVSVFL